MQSSVVPFSLCRIEAAYSQHKNNKSKEVVMFKSHVNSEMFMCSICTFAGKVCCRFDKSIFSNNDECRRHSKDVFSMKEYFC